MIVLSHVTAFHLFKAIPHVRITNLIKTDRRRIIRHDRNDRYSLATIVFGQPDQPVLISLCSRTVITGKHNDQHPGILKRRKTIIFSIGGRKRKVRCCCPNGQGWMTFTEVRRFGKREEIPQYYDKK